MSKYMFGADPEMFIIEASSNRVLPAYILFPETGKGKCFPLGDKYGGIHADNVMLEFNPEPSPDIWGMFKTLYQAKQIATKNIVSIMTKRPIKSFRAAETYIIATSVYEMDPKGNPEIYLNNTRFMEFGCEPDFNAYTRTVNPSPALPEKLRVAGGHLMISCADERLKDPEIVFSAVRWMDVFVAPLLSLANERYVGAPKSSIIQRRQYYGGPGCFRPKEFPNGMYGIEYRTPGPEWTLLGEINKAQGIVNEIGGAMVRSVEYALNFKPYNIDKNVIDAAILSDDSTAVAELLEIANYV